MNRRAAFYALPVGVVLGALLGLGVILLGNSDYREQGGWSAFGYWLLVGAIAGGVSALTAVAGGFVAILVTHRLVRATGATSQIGPAGPAAGASAPWVIAAGVVALAGDPATATIAFGVGFVAAVIGWVSAALLLRTEKPLEATT